MSTPTEDLKAALTKLNSIVQELEEWLADNTEAVFEEEPEVDDIRCELHEQAQRLHAEIANRKP